MGQEYAISHATADVLHLDQVAPGIHGLRKLRPRVIAPVPCSRYQERLRTIYVSTVLARGRYLPFVSSLGDQVSLGTSPLLSLSGLRGDGPHQPQRNRLLSRGVSRERREGQTLLQIRLLHLWKKRVL